MQHTTQVPGSPVRECRVPECPVSRASAERRAVPPTPMTSPSRSTAPPSARPSSAFFKNYVKFNGRASRSEFWFAYLLTGLGALIPYILLIIGLVMMSVSASGDPYGFSGPSGASLALMGIGGTLMGLFVLATLIPLDRDLLLPAS